MINFLKSDMFLFFNLTINIVLFVMVIMSNLRIRKMNKKSNEFMRKLGNGKDIKEDISKYMNRIVDLEEALSETNSYCKQLNKKVEGCVQKVGIVRFSAYKNSGNDLSFAVALLDEKNNGVVFNGLYSREMSSTYAKPVINGKSTYTMTPEENQAILRAMEDERN